MLQWMGGSRRKVTSSRKSIHNRQKQYFEQRKRQQQVSGHEHLSDTQKQSHYHEEPRSLDILSLINLATVSQQGYSSKTNELNIAQVDSHFFQLSPEIILKDTTSGLPEVFEKSCSKPGHITPIKDSAENSQKVPILNSSRTKTDKTNVQSSPHAYRFNNINQSSKQEVEVQNEISVLDLLGDDGLNNIPDEGQAPEQHVAFSVEGLGKTGIGTPAHSPRRYGRTFPSPPKVQKRICSSEKLNYSQCSFGIKRGMRHGQDGSPLEPLCNRSGIFDDENSYEQSTMFTFSCISPDAYKNEGQKLNYEEESIFKGNQRSQPWNVSSYGILDDDLDNKYGAERKKKQYYEDNSLDFDFRATFSPSSRSFFKEGKRSNESVMTSQYFWDLTSNKKRDPISFDGDRHHLYNEKASPDSLFCPPHLSFSPIENSQDSMSFVSEESSSSAAVRDKRRYAVGSHSGKNKKIKVSQKEMNRRHSRKRYDVGKFSADQADKTSLEEFLHEQIRKGARKYKNKNQWHSKSDHSSKKNSAFEGKYNSTISFSDKLVPEDDIFDSFPITGKYSSKKSSHVEPKNNEHSTNFLYETEVLNFFPKGELPSKFAREIKDNFQHSSFDRDFDSQFLGISKGKIICDESEDEYKKCPKKLQKAESVEIEKNSLSSNGRTAGVADSKNKFRKDVEIEVESQEGFDTNETKDPSIENKEPPNPLDDIPSKPDTCTDEKLNHIDGHDLAPSQVATQDPVYENSGPENKNFGKSETYQVMLQLLYVQNVLLEASQKDKGRMV